MPTIKGNPAQQLAYLETKAAALQRKASGKPAADTKAAKKDHNNAQRATKIVSARLETARKNATRLGIKPAKAASSAGEKSADK